MSDLRKFFGSSNLSTLSSSSSSSSSSSRSKQVKRKQPEQDDQLLLAMELSKKQAKIDSMDEQEQLVEAIRRSTESESLPQGSFPPLPESASISSNQKELKIRETKRTQPVAPLFGSRSASTSSEFSGLDSRYLTERPPKVINKFDGSLDLLYHPGWIGKEGARKLFQWMLAELNWHRVTYVRPGTNIQITTPRYTATFGRDDTNAPDSSFRIKPKKIPSVLLSVKEQVEKATNQTYNSLIINYYADGKDSISYHSDDEAFLGENPSIASLSLGSSRDFYLRRKAPAGVEIPKSDSPTGTKGSGPASTRPTEKYLLSDGDLLLMRGRTQAEWEHSVPKRANLNSGRINITFRTVMNPKGTENFQRYNRGDGASFRFKNGKMVLGDGGF